MRRRAVVRVPGSTARLGAGLDGAAAAVDRWLTASVVVQPDAGATTVIQRGGTLARLEAGPAEDWIVAGVRAVCDATGRAMPGALRIRASSQIPVGRGLGSSAAAIVAGASATPAILGFTLTDEELFEICSAVERDPHNVAAAIFGGATRVVQADGVARRVVPVTVPDALALVVTVPAPDASPNVVDDVVKAARGAGASAVTRSGSGTTLIAETTRAQADEVLAVMRAAWLELGVTADGFVSSAQVDGRSLVLHHDCEDAPTHAGAAS
jgi:homoserine kinase